MPCRAVYRARPSHPGVPVGNHEWEPREAPTLHREPSGQHLHFPPRPLGVTAAARLSRRGRHGGKQWAWVPGSSRTEPAASARSCLAFTPRRPAMLGGGPHTSLHPPGLWKPPPSPRTRSEQTFPLVAPLSVLPPAQGQTAPIARPHQARPLAKRSGLGGSVEPAPAAPRRPVPLGTSNRTHAGFFPGRRKGPKDRQWVQITLRAAEPERLWYGSRGVSSLLLQAHLTLRSSPTHPAGASQPPSSSFRCVRPGGSAWEKGTKR